MKSQIASKKEIVLDVLAKVGMSLAIVAVLFFLITFLYIPSLSYSIFQNHASFSGLSGYDGTLAKTDLLITQYEDFTDLKGKVIVFHLKGYGGADGIKAYRALTYIPEEEATPDPVTGVAEDYYIVASTGTAYSFPWKVTESMYKGAVSVRIPGIGAVTGFLSSQQSIIFYVGAVITLGGIYAISTFGKDKHRHLRKAASRNQQSRK